MYNYSHFKNYHMLNNLYDIININLKYHLCSILKDNYVYINLKLNNNLMNITNKYLTFINNFNNFHHNYTLLV